MLAVPARSPGVVPRGASTGERVATQQGTAYRSSPVVAVCRHAGAARPYTRARPSRARPLSRTVSRAGCLAAHLGLLRRSLGGGALRGRRLLGGPLLGQLLERADVGHAGPADRVEARAGRHEAAEDDVLLEADEVVDLAGERGLGEHVGRVLERGGRQPALRRERRLRDTEEQRLPGGRGLALGNGALVGLRDVEALDGLAREVVAVAAVDALDVLEHLAHDDLDVLVVHAHALAAVHLLDLVDQVAAHGVGAARLEQVVGVDAAAGERVAGLDAVAVLDDDAHRAVDLVRLDELAVVGGDGHAHAVVLLLERDDAVDLGDHGPDLGLARLHQLDHAREALRDVGAGGDAARVERAHRELRAGLADRLGGDRADRLAEADVAHQRHVHAVAADAHAGARLAGQRAADGHGLDLGVVGHAGGDGLDVLHVEDLARLLLEVADLEVERQAAAVQAHLEVAAGARASLGRVERDLEELGAAAVLLAHDDLVGDVDELAGQVAGVGGPEGRVGAALAGAVRRDEVLEDVEALAEVRADRQLDGLARRAGHQAAHARQLTDLLRVAAGARLRHDVERVERHVLREVLEHRVLDLLGRVVPQADDLVEALALGHEAALGGLLDAGELALRVLEDLLLLLGDRHVLDADRDARGRGELEAVLLQAVEEGGGALDAEALEALDDEVAQGAPLVDGVVANQLGGDVAARGERLAHDAAEHGAAGAGLDELAVDADRDGVLHVDVALLHRHERLVDAAEAVLQATDARLPARDRDRRVEVELALGVGLEREIGRASCRERAEN